MHHNTAVSITTHPPPSHCTERTVSHCVLQDPCEHNIHLSYVYICQLCNTQVPRVSSSMREDGCIISMIGRGSKVTSTLCLPQGDLSLANGTKPCIHCDLPLDCTLFWALCSTEETPQHIPQRELLCVVIRIKCKSLEYSPRAVTAVQNSDVT